MKLNSFVRSVIFLWSSSTLYTVLSALNSGPCFPLGRDVINGRPLKWKTVTSFLVDPTEKTDLHVNTRLWFHHPLILFADYFIQSGVESNLQEKGKKIVLNFFLVESSKNNLLIKVSWMLLIQHRSNNEDLKKNILWIRMNTKVSF